MIEVVNKKIRVLVVDDSFFMKKLLSELLLTDFKIEVVGTAKDGEDAVVKAHELKPDVITMDYSMPVLNGVQAIKKILNDSQAGNPGIIMVSAYTGKESEAALEALRAGAVDFIQKPSGELSFDIDKIKDELIEKVHAAARAKITKFSDSDLSEKKKNLKSVNVLAQKVIVIGASTGGPPLVEEILKGLPKKFPASIVVVQHMPNYFTRKFAERLDQVLPMSVKWAQTGDSFLVGEILVMPAEDEMEINNIDGKNIIKFVKSQTPFQGIHPSIDRVMSTLTKTFSSNVIGVILTGMGEDGLLGMAHIKKSGGFTIAQDPETATIDSMPDAVIKAKLADEVLRPENIIKRLIDLVK